MFHRVDSNSYGAYSNAGPSPAPAPRPAEPAPQQGAIAKFVNTVKQQGEVPGSMLLPSGIQANREAHVATRVDEARNQYVTNNMTMTNEEYVSNMALKSFAKLPQDCQNEDALNYSITLAEQIWEEGAASLVESWNNSGAHQQAIDSATREWDQEVDSYACTLAQQDLMAPVRSPSTQPVPQPGSASRAIALRAVYAALDEASRPALTEEPGLGTAGETAVRQAPGIPLSRKDSVDELIKTALTAAQTQKKSKQLPHIVNIVRKGVEKLNAKAGKEQISPEDAVAFYKEQTKNKIKLPEGMIQVQYRWRAKIAKERGVGETSSDYAKDQRARHAEMLRLGFRNAKDYEKHLSVEHRKIAPDAEIEDSST